MLADSKSFIISGSVFFNPTPQKKSKRFITWKAVRGFLLLRMSFVARNHLLDVFSLLPVYLKIALIQVVRSAADICWWCTMFSPIVLGAALFILRAVRGRAKSKFNKKQTRAGKTAGDKRGCACTRGCGQWNAAGDQRRSCVCAPRARLSVCVSQSVSWAAAASPWLFSLQMSCAGMWVFILAFILKKKKHPIIYIYIISLHFLFYLKKNRSLKRQEW